MLQKHFNYIALDLFNIKNNLNNLNDIYNFIDALCKDLNLQQINKPSLIPYYHGKVSQDAGISVFSLLKTGHITLHIFEKRNLAYFDIMCFDSFNEKLVVEKVVKFCNAKNYKLYNSFLENKNIEDKFGPDFVCYGKLNKKLSINEMYAIQKDIIKKINMTPICVPNVYSCATFDIIFIAIAESHITLIQKNNNLYINIFSCTMFDVEKLKPIINKYIAMHEQFLYYRKVK